MNTEFVSRPGSPVHLKGVGSRVGKPFLLGLQPNFSPMFKVRGARTSRDENSESVRIGYNGW
jgi:hypothetical protein